MKNIEIWRHLDLGCYVTHFPQNQGVSSFEFTFEELKPWRGGQKSLLAFRGILRFVTSNAVGYGWSKTLTIYTSQRKKTRFSFEWNLIRADEVSLYLGFELLFEIKILGQYGMSSCEVPSKHSITDSYFYWSSGAD